MRVTPFFFCLLCGTIFSAAWAQAQRAPVQQAPVRPNIVIIVPDDLGWADVGYNGSFIRTPHIDALARNGVRLDQHYVMPTCTPTRVALMTGRYPSRYGITGPDYGEVIYRGDATLASILARNGYATFISGKWHMGSPPHTPMQYGFQSSYGYLDGQIDPYTHEYKDGRESWHRNDTLFDEAGHATDLITAEAVRVIEAPREAPFFLYVTYSVPHYPLAEPEEWTSLYDSLNLYPSLRLFAASVTHMDAGIGKIMEALDRTGQRENTVVMFTSDNGGQRSWQDTKLYHGQYADKPHKVLGNNFPLRGWKGDLYEGAIRVPAIVSWPGRLAPRAAGFPMHVSDCLPTLCAAANIEKDLRKLKVDGKDVLSQLSGLQTEPAPRQFYWKAPRVSAVRDGDWKLVVTRGKEGNTEELFNLADDFREQHDLSQKYPERKEAMLELLAEFAKGDGKKR